MAQHSPVLQPNTSTKPTEHRLRKALPTFAHTCVFLLQLFHLSLQQAVHTHLPNCSIYVDVCIQTDTCFTNQIGFLTSHLQVGVVLVIVIRCVMLLYTHFLLLDIRNVYRSVEFPGLCISVPAQECKIIWSMKLNVLLTLAWGLSVGPYVLKGPSNSFPK